MVRFNSEKLSITWLESSDNLTLKKRKYTLTHSDRTGDLFLSIGSDYDYKKIKKPYVRFMRDEVLGEWIIKEKKLELHIHVHVSGGFIFGWAKLRDTILRSHLPLVLELFKFAEPESEKHSIYVHFHSKKKKYNKVELWHPI